jgi:hypothetical protein
LQIIAVTLIAAGPHLSPATARAELHNITYIARIYGVAPGSQASFVIEGGGINSVALNELPNQVFERSAMLEDPQKAGLRIVLRWPNSANVHCEIDVDGHVVIQVDRRVTPAPDNGDPMNGVLQCGAPITA